jgi:hypothetical protein
VWDARLSESERALAKSNFDRPRWPLAQTITWIASPKIETLAHYEARFLGLTRARITNQKIEAIAHSNNAILGVGYAGAALGAEGLASHNPDAVDELLKALRWDKLKALGPDHKPLPPEFWDAQSSSDPGTWPDVWFLREDVLRQWPALETATECGSQAGVSLEAKAGKEAGAPPPKQAPQSASLTENVRDRSPAETGRVGGRKSGEKRRGDRAWVPDATKLAKEAYSRNPAASNDNIASEIDSNWKRSDVEPPGHRTLSEFVSGLRGTGELPQRRPSLPK